MNAPDYQDIPGTYVFDGAHCRKGYALNMFCKSLDVPQNREVFRTATESYLRKFHMTEEQLRAVRQRDWLAMLRLGGNIYYTFKLAIFDKLTMQHVGAAMNATPMDVEEFREMMLRGGRPIEGNRSSKDARHG